MYIDPGFGGMLLQIILAIIAVGGGILYSLRRKIRSLFSKNKDEKINQDSYKTTSNDDDGSDHDSIDMIDENKDK